MVTPPAPLPILPLPTELITLVLQLAIEDSSTERCPHLITFALISRQFHSIAYSLLYRDLHISWTAQNALLLLRTLRADPSLGEGTRTFRVTCVWRGDWRREWTKRREREIQEKAGLLVRRPSPDNAGDSTVPNTTAASASSSSSSDSEDTQRERDLELTSAAKEAWGLSGNGRWDAAGHRTHDIEELLSTIAFFPSLHRLSLTSFHNRNTLSNPLDDPRFSSARLIISRLKSLDLDDCFGRFGGRLVELVEGSYSLSIISSSLWTTETRINPVSASPTRLALIGRLELQHHQFTNLINPSTLQHLSFTLQPTISSTPPHEQTPLASWIPLLSNIPLLDSLLIHLAPRGRSPFDSRSSATFRPTHHSPSMIAQAAFGEYLATASLRSLAIEWWPTSSLIANLPATITLLDLGRHSTMNEEAEGPSAHLERSDLAAVLRSQRLPNLRVVGLPVIKAVVKVEAATANDIRDDMEEFGLRSGELQGSGIDARVSGFGC